MPKHTPLPWKTHAVDDCSIVNNDGNFAASTFIDADDYEENHERREADAALIVQAVNSHAALTEAVRDMIEALETAQAFIEISKEARPVWKGILDSLTRAKELVK